MTLQKIPVDVYTVDRDGSLLLGRWYLPAVPAVGNTVFSPKMRKYNVTGVTWNLGDRNEDYRVRIRVEVLDE